MYKCLLAAGYTSLPAAPAAGQGAAGRLVYPAAGQGAAGRLVYLLLVFNLSMHDQASLI